MGHLFHKYLTRPHISTFCIRGISSAYLIHTRVNLELLLWRYSAILHMVLISTYARWKRIPQSIVTRGRTEPWKSCPMPNKSWDTNMHLIQNTWAQYRLSLCKKKNLYEYSSYYLRTHGIQYRFSSWIIIVCFRNTWYLRAMVLFI